MNTDLPVEKQPLTSVKLIELPPACQKSIKALSRPQKLNPDPSVVQVQKIPPYQPQATTNDISQVLTHIATASNLQTPIKHLANKSQGDKSKQ